MRASGFLWAGRGSGAEMPSLQCSGGSPGNCSRWGLLAVLVLCRYTLSDGGISTEPGLPGSQGVGVYSVPRRPWVSLSSWQLG